MNLRPLTRAEVRQVDRTAIEQYGMSGLVLMENAGRDSAREITRRFTPGDVCILCGKGNNAGDGYVIARHLQWLWPESAGWDLRIVSLTDPNELQGDAAANYRIARAAGITILTAAEPDRIAEAVGLPDLLIDCMLGTGASGEPREPFASAIRLANRLSVKRIAVDLPSGLDCDTGEPEDPTFQADLTLTFVAAKVGFSQRSADAVLGDVVVIPIGVPARMLEPFQAM